MTLNYFLMAVECSRLSISLRYSVLSMENNAMQCKVKQKIKEMSSSDGTVTAQKTNEVRILSKDNLQAVCDVSCKRALNIYFLSVWRKERKKDKDVLSTFINVFWEDLQQSLHWHITPNIMISVITEHAHMPGFISYIFN